MQEQSITVTLDGRPCVVPDAGRFPEVARLANSYWCPLGPAVGRAWVLMLRRDLDAIHSDAGAYHELVFQTRRRGRAPDRAAFGQLLMVGSRRLTPGGPRAGESLHLVEMADRRLLLARFSDTGNLQQNIRSYAQDADYLTGTGGYTWASAAAEIWNTMSDLIGSFPGLPSGYTPDGAPENLRLVGVGAWQALDRVLGKIGCTVAYDPLAGAFSIVHLGSKQAGLPATIAGGQKLLDAEPLEENAAKYPETIRVYFHNHYRSFGQERDTELADNWSVGEAGASIDVPTNLPGAVAGTVLPLWDDLPRVLDEDNNPSNSGDLAARANARAAEWLAERQTGRRRREVFPGIVTGVVPGAEIKAVLWRAWGPDAGGTATEILCHGGLPRRVTGGATLGDGLQWDRETYSGENFAPPDLARRSYPNYPRLPNIVQVYHSAGSQGDWVSPNADHFHDGRVKRWVAGSMATLDPCWIRLVDDHDNADGDQDAIDGSYYLGRLSGMETSGGVTRPLYLARRGGVGELVRFELTGTMELGDASAAGEKLVWNGSAYVKDGHAITLVDSVGRWAGAGGYRGWAVKMNDRTTVSSTDAYEIVFLESLARWIEFTLTEDMGATTTGEASATVDNSWGAAPNGKSPGSTATVYDRQSLFTAAKSGERGLAVLDEQQTLYAAPAYKYVIVRMEPSSYRLKYAKAQSDWVKNSGDPKVSCKDCDRDGTNETGSAFDVYLPIKAPSGSPDYTKQPAPNVLSGDVVGYLEDKDGRKVAATDYLDDPWKTIKMFSGSAVDVPGGWALCDGSANASTGGGTSGGDGTDLSGRFIVGYDSSPGSDYSTIGNTGGATTHTHANLAHAKGTQAVEWDDNADGSQDGINDHVISSENHLPPYYTLAFIQRVLP